MTDWLICKWGQRAIDAFKGPTSKHKKTNFSSWFQPRTSCTHSGFLPVFVMLQQRFFFFGSPLRKVSLVLLPEALEMIDSESVIHQTAVLSCHQQVALQFLQLSQRKKLNRQHNQPRNPGHIAIYWKQIGAGSCCHLLPALFSTECPYDQQLQSQVNRVKFYAEMVGESKG